MRTWTVDCGKCGHAWKLVGNWSVYEREAVESRPCPHCGGYTLKCPEPTAPARGRIGRGPVRVPRAVRVAG